mmetsp:Transcript_11428/g.25467  ORF Transcript_11428/g.25467 Transcript_11428/m.25467 type:complete len:228 (-) Transcript_11428:72-755(-)|eukprot:2163128-Amphidinium_carterae.2
MALYPPSALLKPLDPEVCWESDLTVRVAGKDVPVHRSVLTDGRSRFLAELLGQDLAGTDPVKLSPPFPELVARALHAITTGTRPELTEDEFVGFVQTSAFLQSDVLDARLCEAALDKDTWSVLTRLEAFRNPKIPPRFLEKLLVLAREHEATTGVTVGEALTVLALWCSEDITGGDTVLEQLLGKVQNLDASELTRLQQLNPRFVELLSSTEVYNIMKKGYERDLFI